jgi:hypothetical protein
MGLLDTLQKLGSKVHSAATSPTGMGILGAAAMGVNPLVGLLAAPGIRADRERAAQESEARNMALQQARQQQQARGGIADLLGQRSMMAGQNEMSLLNLQGGADVMPVSGRAGLVPTAATPEGQQKLMGLLAQAAPDAVFGGLAGQMFPNEQSSRTPTDIAAMDALGIPRTPEGFAQYQAMKNSGDGDLQGLIDRVTLSLRENELERERRTAADEERNKTVTRQLAQSGVRNSMDALLEASDILDRLEGTLLSPGVPFNEALAAIGSGAEAVKGLFGVSDAKARQTINDFNRLNKLNSSVILKNLGEASGSGGLGTITNQKMGLVQNSLGGLGVDPQTNRSIYADSLRDLLDVANIEGFDFDTGRYSDRLNQLRRRTAPQAGSTPIPGVNLNLPEGFSVEIVE